MKRVIIIVCLLVLTTASIFSQQSDFPKVTGPYLDQKPPGITPEIFAPGIVSVNGSDEWGLTIN